MFINTRSYKMKTESQPEGVELHVVTLFTTNGKYNEITNWCYNTFGEPGTRWQDLFASEIHFSQKKDFEWFLLKWS